MRILPFALKDYLARIALLQHVNAASVFVGFTKPHKSVTLQNFARWIKQLMADASINTFVFKQHSTSSALAPWIGKTKDMSVAQICKQDPSLQNPPPRGNSTIKFSFSKLDGSIIHFLVKWARWR